MNLMAQSYKVPTQNAIVYFQNEMVIGHFRLLWFENETIKPVVTFKVKNINMKKCSFTCVRTTVLCKKLFSDLNFLLKYHTYNDVSRKQIS